MCNAVFLAAFLAIALAGLTLLRCTRSASPNALMLTRALASLEGPDCETPGDEDLYETACVTGRDALPCPS
ncbi:MAG: hypothetical protein KUA35_11155 [Pseudodesulfovibrio sp.]|uniref:Electron transport complex, RnfABCDGE type, B n=1 Tax=Pseudodesulfovibrio aespoeensis (strain ATCC 700646 / DSM 10631 / Aspo-2) TaxID=643562 RepID=E6VTY5_PSEA9|nr:MULTISPECIES: electron transport complex, RnfABCDGE type, subunit B [Pseudodesulfovibrio]MBU4192766.1 hypothetical protein [Pseudomonadota bacterium]ADU61077.1 electron transport complex, RnfABCDGE type, B [Pseudodesulfovibrio aespoeensis Aspo-2]MBU4244096.1 hypothetical protein [Pseudomonadota bacterium]MBU4379317.1 hypothetical protein [Pseudomonadota bacterium]MBU4476457.1 hypothetical protein [Pseudomonadota bacterium]